MVSMEILNLQNSVLILGVLVVSQVPCLLSCNSRDISQCPQIDQVTEVWNFILNPDQWPYEQKCSESSRALSCALMPQHTDGCAEILFVKYKADKAFTDAICDTYKYAYLKGLPCFTKDHVITELRQCKRSWDRGMRRDACEDEVFTEARECIREAAEHGDCSQEDANLLVLIGELFLRPWNDVKGCDWEPMTNGPIATPTTMAAKTTVTTSTAPTTMVPTEGFDDVASTTETTENVGRVKGGSSKLAAPTNLLLGFLFLFACLFA